MLLMRYRQPMISMTFAGLASIMVGLPANGASLSGAVPGASTLWESNAPIVKVREADAAFRRWLRQMRARDQRAADLLDGKASREDELSLGREFKAQRQGEYKKWLARHARSGSHQAAAVLHFMNTGEYLDPDVTIWRKNLVNEFEDQRYRERDFIFWLRKKARAGDNEAIEILSEEDDFNNTLSAQKKADIKKLRARKMASYTKLLNDEYAEYENLIDNLTPLLKARVKMRPRLSNDGDQPGATVSVQNINENSDAIDVLLDAIGNKIDEIEGEFGVFNANPLYRTAVVSDDRGKILRAQATYDSLCGIASGCMLDGENIDDVLLNEPSPNEFRDGSWPRHWRRQLRRRGLEAETIDVTVYGDNPNSRENREEKIRTVQDALRGSDHPVMVSISNDNSLQRFFDTLGTTNLNLLENSLSENKIWEKLKKIKTNNEYSHIIVVDDVIEFDKLRQAHIRDPNAEHYSVSADALARAMYVQVTYVPRLLPGSISQPGSSQEGNTDSGGELSSASSDAISLDAPSEGSSNSGN